MKKTHLATVLASLTVGSLVGVTVQQSASAEVSSGDRPVLVQISPCRLADTRPGVNNVGPRSGAIGAGETQQFDVQDSSTDCAGLIPTDAVGISTNVTALGASSQSFFTIWASGTRPLASSLNPAPGEPPTPNAVTTPIDDGKFNVYNKAGNAHAVIDINGYYVHHTHDDLYEGGNGPTTVSVGAASFDAWESEFTWAKDLGVGEESSGAWITGSPHGGGVIPGLAAPIQLPDGATVTSATAYFEDTSLIASLNIQLRCAEHGGSTVIVAQGDSVAAPSSGETDMSVTTTNAVVDNSRCSYFVMAESGSWASEAKGLKIRGVAVTLD